MAEIRDFSVRWRAVLEGVITLSSDSEDGAVGMVREMGDDLGNNLWDPLDPVDVKFEAEPAGMDPGEAVAVLKEVARRIGRRRDADGDRPDSDAATRMDLEALDDVVEILEARGLLEPGGS